jgi:microcystin-dependent protein
MTSGYPAAIDDISPAGKSNSTAMVDDHPGHHNLLADAIEQIERTLGINPHSGYADVAARLAAIVSIAGAPAGAGALWFSNTAPSGWAILDGSTITNAQTNNPALWANVDATWKSGSNIVLPDMRGRFPMGKGTHTDVDTLGKNEGEIVGNRRWKHFHGKGTLNVTAGGSHAHGGVPIFDGSQAGGGGASGGAGGGTAAATHTHPSSEFAGSVGTTSAAPAEGPAALVVNFIIKL